MAAETIDDRQRERERKGKARGEDVRERKRLMNGGEEAACVCRHDARRLR